MDVHGEHRTVATMPRAISILGKKMMIGVVASLAVIGAGTGAALASAGHPGDAGLPRSRVPVPVVTGPITGGAHGRPFTSSPVPLADAGYVEQEYFLSGTATGYLPVGTWGSDGRWKVRPAETAPYKTRILVRRPASPARFNGVVVVEWLNVSFNADVDPDFLYASQELLRAGYAWVGVSAQQLGVQGPDGLANWDPARYGALHHPGDTFSYSIFSQAAAALLYGHRGPSPLGPLHPRALIADGESQSASRMVTYANAIQPVDRLFSGFLIHSRGAGGSPVSQPPQPSPPLPPVAMTRTDIGVPVLTVETETDILGLGYYPATQPDSRWFRLWEVPGTSHVNLAELGLSASEVLRDIPSFPQGSCKSQPNDNTDEQYVMNSAVARLARWARTGAPAPSAPRVEVANGNYVRDSYGNVLGGLRTPAVNAPAETLTGGGNTGGTLLCILLGTSAPLSNSQLAALYPLHSDYVAAVEKSSAEDVAAGYLLPQDALAIDENAATSKTALPAPTG
jgi:hypothetical protein